MLNNSYRTDYYSNEKRCAKESNVGHVGAVNPENLDEDHKLRVTDYKSKEIYTDDELDKIDNFKF